MKNVVEGALQSSLLQREIPYRVVLPRSYLRESSKRYPVLYLLHGLFGCCNNWLNLTRLGDYALDKELIIVLPEGGDGWYTDGATVEEEKFESYIIEELIPQIDLLYRTGEKRERRAIAGLSMGGYGALKFGLKRPDLFASAASISGAFDAARRTDKNPGFDWENLRPSILRVFAEEHSPARTQNDLFRIIERIPAERIAALPHFYLVCGDTDGFLRINRELARLLQKRRIPFEYFETPGGHDWGYWDGEIKRLLPLIEKKLGPREL